MFLGVTGGSNRAKKDECHALETNVYNTMNNNLRYAVLKEACEIKVVKLITFDLKRARTFCLDSSS